MGPVVLNQIGELAVLLFTKVLEFTMYNRHAVFVVSPDLVSRASVTTPGAAV